MADKEFMAPRRGGTATEQRLSARVATTDGVRNDAGYGRGQTTNDPRIVNQIGGGRGLVNPTNAFSHDENNTTTSSKEILELDFRPNILDNYDVYTYHWKLFISPLESVTTGVVLDPAVQTIIAESGVSDLTIDKIELHGITTPSVEAGTGTMTTVKFEIMEPSGAGLIDKMFYQAQALGIANWLVMPCFLQLEFRGRDPLNSNPVINGAPSGLGSLRWVWPIKLTGSKINVTTVGTRYEFDAIMYGEIAQTNSCGTIPAQTVLNNLDTFGKAMRDLEDKLNADQYEKLIDNYSIPDTYTIVVDPVLAKIELKNLTANKDTKRGADFIDLSKKTASFNAGTGIDKIVDSLLGSSSYFQKKVQDSDTPSSEPKASNAETTQMKKLWRIVTETKPIAYDSLRQDNAVAMTLYIVEYDIGILEATAAQTGQTPETIPAAKKRMIEYVKKKILQKKYNYIFTGLNDQILSLDLNLNYAFAAAMARFGGIYIDGAAGIDKSIAMQKNAEDEKNATEQVRKTLQYINNPPAGANIDKKIADATKAVTDAKISPVNKARYIEILSHARPADRKAWTTKIQAAHGIDSTASAGGLVLDTALVKARTSAASLSPIINNGNNLRFISDVNINSQTAKTAHDISLAMSKSKLRPIPFREAPQEGNLALGTDPSSDAGRARTSSMFATALYSSLDASMTSIKLVIKGDPFWLFPRQLAAGVTALPYRSNMPDQMDAIRDIKRAHIDYPESVNILGTDNFIVIRFRTPRIYNEVSGVVDPFTEVEMFSGVYKVVRITSKFATGKFTQELECIIDPVIELSQFLNDIDAASRKLDKEVPISTNNIPASAIKKPRILGAIDDKINNQVASIKNSIGQVVTTATDAQGFVTHTTHAASNIPSDVGFTASQQLERVKPTSTSG